MSWDYVNAAFELVGSCMVWLNVLRIVRDKGTSGISGIATSYFWAWSVWGLFYYPALNQPASFIGCVFMAAGNSVFAGLMWYYHGQKIKRKETESA